MTYQALSLSLYSPTELSLSFEQFILPSLLEYYWFLSRIYCPAILIFLEKQLFEYIPSLFSYLILDMDRWHSTRLNIEVRSHFCFSKSLLDDYFENT